MTREDWRRQAIEEAIEPDLPIIDAHHHLWMSSPMEPWEEYRADALFHDMEHGGHNVFATIYTDSHANFYTDGPEALRPVGEVEFAHEVAEQGRRRGGRAAGACAAIVSSANLLLGSAVGEVLDAQAAASPRFRGIRYMTAIDPDLPPVFGATEFGIMMRPAFREGFAELVRRDMTFDAWAFQSQLAEVIDLVRSFPEARIIIDHVGGPIGVGRFAGNRDAYFGQWKADMAVLAQFPNVTVKLGALNMWHTGMCPATEDAPPFTSEQTAAAQRDHVLTTIDLFGPDRCMFESNFPVDMRMISYTVAWNSFKRMTADMSATDRTALFSGTATRVYRPDLPVAAA
jgi:predicted TIM-barrel fold metal-dependent hydrolase